MNTQKQTFVVALAMMLVMVIAPTMAFGQNKDDKQSTASPTEEQGNDLVGVWEEVGPATVDCQTREPNAPAVRALLMFNQGGTMTLEDTFPLEGPYRTTGAGIWKRTSGRNYTYINRHYSFDPDKTFTGIVKIRSSITLGKDSNSFTEKGTVKVTDPSGNVVFTGCFNGTAYRLKF